MGHDRHRSDRTTRRRNLAEIVIGVLYAIGAIAQTVSTLPQSEKYIDEWCPLFYLEIWVLTPNSTDRGIRSALVTLEYDTQYFTAIDVAYGAGFELSHPVPLGGDTGLIETIQAQTSRADVGDDKPALVARVTFAATQNDPGVNHNALSWLQNSQRKTREELSTFWMNRPRDSISKISGSFWRC